MKNNRPSATALFVANGMYFNSKRRRLRKDIPEETRASFVALIENIYGIKRTVLRKRLHLMKCYFSQRFTIDGFYLHFLLRKKCIEHEVLQAIRSGCKQVVILGAGYDPLGINLANKFPEVRFTEVDHPATSVYKQSVFNRLKWERPNLFPLSCDLNNAERLFSSEKFDRHAKTMIVCEAVLMYLPSKAVGGLFDVIRKNFSKCKLVFTFMNEQAPGDYMFRDAHPMTNNYLRLNSEPFTWGIPVLGVESYLKERGWRLLDIFDDHRLRKDFLSPANQDLPLAIGELIVSCEPLNDGK